MIAFSHTLSVTWDNGQKQRKTNDEPRLIQKQLRSLLFFGGREDPKHDMPQAPLPLVAIFLTFYFGEVLNHGKKSRVCRSNGHSASSSSFHVLY
jgi:hypothetical protein